MKHIIVLFFILLPHILMANTTTSERLALYNARAHGAEVLELVQVVDQDGIPVEHAKLWGGLQTGDGYNDYTSIDGFTNEDGQYVIKGKCTDRLVLRITKDGYYTTDFEIPYDRTMANPKVKDGKWQPYGSQRTIVLKKIINPQPMLFHDGRTSFKIPIYEQWIGFDCEVYDFVSPYGRGVNNDILLRFTRNTPAIDEYHETMEVSFTNNPYAGAYEMKRANTSEFESIYHADTNAVYRQSFFYRFDQSPTKVPKYTEQLKSDEYLVFRTRTKVDSEGRLISAMYGKIYGEWYFVGPGGMSIEQFVFNSTPNDTNLEDLYTAERSLRAKIDREAPPYKKKRKSFWPF